MSRFQVNSSGRANTIDGKGITPTGGPCCCAGEPCVCSFCSGAAAGPPAWDVVLSGATSCFDIQINGTFCADCYPLGGSAICCAWQDSFTSPTAPTPRSQGLAVYKSATHIGVQVSCSTTGLPFALTHYSFYGRTASTTCSTVTVSNMLPGTCTEDSFTYPDLCGGIDQNGVHGCAAGGSALVTPRSTACPI